MGAVEQLGMTLTWQSASIVDFAKKLARLMPLLKGPTLSLPLRLTRLVKTSAINSWDNPSDRNGEWDVLFYRNSCMTRKSCLRTETGGKLRLQKISGRKAFIAELGWSFSYVVMWKWISYEIKGDLLFNRHFSVFDCDINSVLFSPKLLCSYILKPRW